MNPAPITTNSIVSAHDFSISQGVAVAYLGISAVLARWFEVRVFGFGSSLFVAFGLALVGWRQPMSSGLRRHFNRSALFATWILVSAVAAWSGGVLYRSVTLALWVAFVIPGLARTFQNPVYRRVLRWSLIAGAGFYVGFACVRVATRQPILDAAPPGISPSLLLGVNRNLVNLWVTGALGLVFAARPSQATRLCQALFVLASITWLLGSGGRTGFIGILVVALVLAFTDTNVGQRQRTLLRAIAATVVLVAVVQTVPSTQIKTIRRFEVLESSSRDSGDQIRTILTEKAWHLGYEHPFFGVGVGQFESTYDRAVERASTPHIKETASVVESHNTYLEVFATTGIVGLILFAGVFLRPLFTRLRRIEEREARATAASFAAILVSVVFHTALGAALFVTLALLLAALAPSEV